MELDRARAVADVAQVLINSVKVEVDFMKATGAITAPSGFLTDTTRPQLRKVD